jgi:4-hydroxy-tetrahydrodipicolinate synthase
MGNMRGVWTALITPFNEKNQVDLTSYRKILQNQREAKVTGVIPCGTTGETPTLSTSEKKILIQVAIEEMKGSGVQVVAGTGTHDTSETVEFSAWASDQGVNGILVVTPYYNKPSQSGLAAHFLEVADSVNCEVVLYNVPGRTGVSLAPETIVKLSKHSRITTLKEATGNISLTSEIIDQLISHQSSLDILAGDDATFLPMLSVGAAGIISVASNLFPRAMVAIQRAVETGQLQEARRIHQTYYPLFRDLFLESNPVPIKHALATTGWCEPHVRLPLAPLSPHHAEILNATLRRCEIFPGGVL